MSLKHLKEGSEMPPFTKGTLRLYSNAYCPFAHRTRLILDAKNIPYEKVNINLALKPEWYQKLVPGGQVPCLQLPDGRVLPESLINSEYLDQAYPGPKLAPSDPYENANHKVFVERYSKFIGSFYKAFRGKDDEALADFKAALDQLEPQLPAKGFLGGDKPAFADYMIWPWLERLEIVERVQSVKFEREKYPNLLGYIDRLKEVPAVKKNFTSPEKHYQFYLSYIGSNGGKDANYDL